MRKNPLNFSRSISPLEAILGMMACISLILMVSPKDWTRKTFDVDPTVYQVNLSGDGFSGGNSTATWIDKDTQHWRCDLGKQFITPYCSLNIRTTKSDWTGLNLNGYSDITLWGTYKGNAQHIRFYLRNRHPDYYVMGDDTTTKYNVVEIPVTNFEKGITFRMKDFSVADWWLTSKNIPLQYSQPDFNDIVYIEVQTGSQVYSGIHDVQLKKIQLSGQYISDETLYRSIIVVWSVSVFLLLLYRVIALKFELVRNQRYQNELISINKLLNLQNKQFEDLAKTDLLTGLLNRARRPQPRGLQALKRPTTEPALHNTKSYGKSRFPLGGSIRIIRPLTRT